ncbi:MAG: DUF4191 domain-containing protein [Cellulomonadaceae bacterium]|jgi:hypothetical protein|nr:DUF4191 domain-containing protein [Cellulomonadaceae bacterium]
MARNDTAPQPKKQRWYHQVWAAYTMTRSVNPAVTWYILGFFVAVMLVGVVVGLLTHNLVFWIVMALPLALLAAMFTLTRNAERAAYQRIEGQPGAARSAMGTVRGGWLFEDEPVAVNPRGGDLVFRGVGRAGVVLVSEGPAARVARLLDDERRKVQRVVPGSDLPIALIQMGDEPGQVPLTKLARTISKLKPKLTKAEVDQLSRRLKALGGVRLPMPKGVDPTRMRPSRKGMR